MFCCFNFFGLTKTRRYVYIPAIILRLPEFIYCSLCKEDKSPIFVVDSYDLEICTGQINIFTSRPFVACYDCKEKINIKNFTCSKCRLEYKKSKYCRGCGILIKYYRFNIKKYGNSGNRTHAIN